MRKRELLSTMIPIFIGLYCFILIVICPGWYDLYRLFHKGVQTQGKVTEKKPEFHQDICYEYWVAGTRYSNQSWSQGFPSFNQIKVGDRIIVTYLPGNPNKSEPGDINEVYWNESMMLFVALPLFCLLAAFISSLRSQRYHACKRNELHRLPNSKKFK